MPVTPVSTPDRKAWRKQYRDDHPFRRRIGLGVLAALVRRLHVDPLRPPPHFDGRRALEIEVRRLQELQTLGVRVPDVLSVNDDVLELSDLGPTLASLLREAAGDDARTDALARAAAAAVADVHRNGAYLGQPLPRNITCGSDGIGFLDFEEDPLQVMTMEQAQARDWVLLAFGMAKYYDHRPQALADVLAEAMRTAPAGVGRQVRRVGEHLRRFAPALRRLGRSARVVAHSVLALHAATTFSALVLLALLVDWSLDGELDLLRLLS